MQKCRGAQKLSTLFHAKNMWKVLENFARLAFFEVKPINFLANIGLNNSRGLCSLSTYWLFVPVPETNTETLGKNYVRFN